MRATMNAVITIIVPIYNMEKYLARCLDSITSQTYSDIEIICVNDGSRDMSLEILERLAEQDRRIKVISQPNRGLAGARNAGISHASGKYIMFCDSDDWYEPTICSEMVRTIEREEVDLVSCRNDFVYDMECGDDIERRDTESKFYTIGYYGRYRMSSVIRFGLNCIVCTKLFRHSIIREHNIRFPEGCEHEDNAFWYIYSFHAKNVYILKEKLYHYFIRRNSIMDKCANLAPKNKFDKVNNAIYVMNYLKGRRSAERFRNDIAYLVVRDSVVYSSLYTNEESVEVCTKLNSVFCDLLGTKLKLLKWYRFKDRTLISCTKHALLRFVIAFVIIKYGRAVLYLRESLFYRFRRVA